MLERLPQFEAEYEDVLQRLSFRPRRDPRALRDLSRRRKELETVVETMRALRSALSDVSTAREMHAESSGEERGLAMEQLDDATEQVAELQEKLRTLLLPKDPNDGRNVIVDIGC